MDLVVVLGKSSKNVQAYILLPPDSQKAINLLLDKRSAVGVPKSNKFVFARLNSDTSLTGIAEMREVSNSCPDLEFPERITSTKLRKYVFFHESLKVS